MCMAKPGITVLRKLKLNLFNLGPFGESDGVAYRL